jgi:hypothetical protein
MGKVCMGVIDVDRRLDILAWGLILPLSVYIPSAPAGLLSYSTPRCPTRFYQSSCCALSSWPQVKASPFPQKEVSFVILPFSFPD